MLNEINALIWPNENGIGIMDEADFKRTADISLQQKVISKPAADEAYRTDIAEDALSEIDEDTKGSDWKKEQLKVAPAEA
jgi:NitT/TauT family transport system substrate-binding protein